MSLSWAAPAGEGVAGAIVEGTLLTLYSFDRFKSSKARTTTAGARVARAGRRGGRRRRGRARAHRRPRPPTPPATSRTCPPTWPPRRSSPSAPPRSRTSTRRSRWSCSTARRSSARGMGAFAAVAQGTYAEPRLIVLRYRPPAPTGPHLGYVGKAVTFDTGGISIKPAAKMQEMKFDMSGGAAVLEAIGRDRAARAAGHAHRRGARHREHAERALGQARRHRHRDERQDHRDQQHRRRGPADPGRRALPTPSSRAPSGSWTSPRSPAACWSRSATPTRACGRTTTTGSRPSRPPARPPARSAGACRSTPSTSS